MKSFANFSELLERLNPAADTLGKLDDSLLKWLQQKRDTGRLISQHISVPKNLPGGCYAVIDFGGTNIRTAVIELQTAGKSRIIAAHTEPLRCAIYDMTKENVTGEELFEFVARQLQKTLEEARAAEALLAEKLPLGHVFSFPCLQKDINSAQLLKWTKEIRTRGVEGQDVQVLLRNALLKADLELIEPAAILNDTTAVLLASQYRYGCTALAGIIGTGHNFGGFLENMVYTEADSAGKFTAHNFESGDFTDIPENLITNLDTMLDAASAAPGEQLLEKMVGGAYLGEIGRLAFVAAGEEFPELRKLAFIEQPYSLKTPELSMVSDCCHDVAQTGLWLKRHGIDDPSAQACKCASTIADAIFKRAARITAAEISAFLASGFIIKYESRPSYVALEGSLYLKTEYFRKCLFRSLSTEFGIENPCERIVSMPDAVLLGAAVAAGIGGLTQEKTHI